MSNHPAPEALFAYLEGETGWWRRKSTERHLAWCWQCRCQVDGWRDAQRLYSELHARESATLPPPPRPWADIEPAPAAVWRANRWSGRLAWTTGLAAAAALAWVAWQPAPRPPTQTGRPRTAPGLPRPPIAEPAPSKTAVSHPRPQPPRPVRDAPMPVPVADMVRVAEAIHHAGLDLGEPVEWSASGGRIVVSAAGMDDEALRELREELARIGGVEVRVSHPAAPPVPERGETVAVAGTDTVLAARLGGPAAAERFVDGVLSNSAGVLARAHALRVLDAGFEGAALSPEEARRVGAIRSVHEVALREGLRTLRVDLDPLLPGLDQPPDSTPALAALEDLDSALHRWLASPAGGGDASRVRRAFAALRGSR